MNESYHAYRKRLDVPEKPSRQYWTYDKVAFLLVSVVVMCVIAALWIIK